MRHRIGMAVVCLHISAALYLLLGIGFLWLFSTQGQTETIIGVVSLVFCLALAAGIEFVVYGLKRRKFWAWIAGVCIFGLYVPSAFLPLGALGMWGLLDRGSREEFGINVGQQK